MIGTFDPEKKKVVVIGAGISGLLAAYQAKKNGYSVELFEATGRVGGLIQTTPVFQKEHFLGISESAAHSLLASPAVQRLSENLGLRLIPVEEDSKSKYFFRKNELKKFPLSFKEIIQTFSHLFFAISKGVKSHTVEEWARLHLGQPALDHLVTPFTQGIYGVPPKNLLLELTYPKLHVPRAFTFISWFVPKMILSKRNRAPMVTFQKGMQSLVNALAQELQAETKLNTKVETLPQDANVILCVPSNEAAKLLKSKSSELASHLEKINYTGLVSVTIFIPKKDLMEFQSGVGVLATKDAGRMKALGVLYNSSSFKDRAVSEMHSFTAMLPAEYLTGSDFDITSAVRSDFELLFGLKSSKEMNFVIHKWKKAIPVYDQNLKQALETASATWCSEKGNILFGNYSGKVSLRGMIEDAQDLI